MKRLDWAELIYQELCKKIKFNRINKLYMNRHEAFFSKETHKNCQRFEI